MIRKGVALLILAAVLTGCGKQNGPTEKALAFRTRLMQSQGCTYVADITADYGERLYEFSVCAEYTPDETNLTVLSPEEISGVSATVTEQGTSISFDDAELDFGKMANGYISPVSVPWLLGQCWVGEYILSAGADGDMERVTYLKGYDEQELTVNTWLDPDGVPVRAEVLYDDRRCLTVTIRDFQF